MKQLAVFLVLVTVYPLAACTTYRGVPLNQIPQRVSAGDSVRLTMRDGSKLEFVVNTVGDEDLSGGGVTRAFADLALVERRGRQRVTPEVVVGWVVIPVAAVGLLVLVILITL